MPRTKTPISYRERSVLAFIKKFHAEKKYMPTLRQMCEATGYRSTSLMSFYLDRLVKAGYIERDPDYARAIRIVEGAE